MKYNKDEKMKKILLLIITVFGSFSGNSQVYDGLNRLETAKQEVYFSSDAKERAEKISESVAKAEVFFEKEFKVHPKYTLLILNKIDWKKYARPKAVYGIPHFLPDGRLVVASEDNAFWKRNMPPLDQLPQELADKFKETYTDSSGSLSLRSFFDLLAIHELGHAFQKAAGLKAQRNWMGELLCNVLLHTYVAENNPKILPALTVFPQIAANSPNAAGFKYKKLNDFEVSYEDIAQNYPENYGWYQCRFHNAAAEVYNAGGKSAMISLWNALLGIKEKLDDAAFSKLLATKDLSPINKVILNWDR